MSKRYYWLKLKRDFFKRHDIRIIENMPNGKDYILFYLKLLCESVDHDGKLRFSTEIPYNENMLATITDTNVDIVRQAVKIFTELNMMEVMDDGTYYMNEVSKMLGSETEWAERKRINRQTQKSIEGHVEDIVGTLSNDEKTLSNKSKSKSKSKNKENIKKKTSPPSHDEARDWYASHSYVFGFERWWQYYAEAEKPWTKADGSPVKDWKRTMLTWQSIDDKKEGEKSNRNNYQGREYTDEELEGLYKKFEGE